MALIWLVDASVALKWVLEEENSPTALDLLDLGPLAAPEFLILECANALTQQVRRRRITAEDAVDRLQFIQKGVPRLIPMAPHLQEAQRLSLRFNHFAYDCLYVATARAHNAVLITADEELADIAEPVYPGSIHRLRSGAPKS